MGIIVGYACLGYLFNLLSVYTLYNIHLYVSYVRANLIGYVLSIIPYFFEWLASFDYYTVSIIISLWHGIKM